MTDCKRIFVCALIGISFAGMASACSAARDLFNNPITIHQDCSFENADTEAGPYGRDMLLGGKAFDLVNTKVAQRISAGNSCMTLESLLVFDCGANEAIAIAAPFDDQDSVGITSSVKLLQPPYGPINLGNETTVASLTAIAQKHNYAFEVLGNDGDNTIGYWDQFPSGCGCKKFYPTSPGADG